MSDHELPHGLGEDGAEDPADLLGLYALGALDDADRRRVEQLLAADPVARAEADRLAAVADQLAEVGAEGASAPPGLLGAILAEASTRPAAGSGSGSAAPTSAPDVEPVVPPRTVAAAGARPGDATVVPFERPASRRPRAAWLVSAAAAVVLVLVVVGGLVLADRSGDGPVDPEVAMEQMARDAAGSPGARTAELTDPAGTMAVEVVVDAQGHAFLMAGVLPTLGPDQTYQLWAVDDGTPVSLGLLGSSPRMAVVGVDPEVHTLAITMEPAGGSADPTTMPMASGTLSQA